MGEIRDIGSKPGPDIICLEGNGSRPSHKGDGYRVGGGYVHIEQYRSSCRVLWDILI